jgi:hypothetical protein
MPFNRKTHGTLTAIVTLETKEEFKRLAKEKRWSVSNYLVFLIEQELKKHKHNSEN